MWLIVPGPLAQRTGGYIYDARMVASLQEFGWDTRVGELASEHSLPQPAAALAGTLASLPDGGLAVIDGLCLAGAAEVLAAERGRLRLVGLVHHPAGLETGVTAECARRLLAEEAKALQQLDRVVVTSPHTARIVERDLSVARQHVAIVEPGTDPAPLACGSEGVSCRLLAVGAVSPRKGYEILLQALAQLRSLAWDLSIVGGLDRDIAYASRVQALVRDGHLTDHVTWEGECDAALVATAYQHADVFVSASWYEGYGMAVAEALARGLPVVATAAGAVADTLPSGAGMLVECGDIDGLAGVLRRVISEPRLRADLASGARSARSALPDWKMQAQGFAAELQRVGA